MPGAGGAWDALGRGVRRGGLGCGVAGAAGGEGERGGVGVAIFAGEVKRVVLSFHYLISRVPPPLPGDKPNGCTGLASVVDAKFGQNKGVIAKFGQTKGLWVKCEAPAVGRGFFLTLYN